MNVVDCISCGRRFNTKDIRLTLMAARTYPIGSADLAVGTDDKRRVERNRYMRLRLIP